MSVSVSLACQIAVFQCWTSYQKQASALHHQPTAAMETSWRLELQSKGVDKDIVEFLETEQVHSSSRFANYLDSREEVMTVILDSVNTLQANQRRAQKTILTELWRECEHAEQLRLSRKATGSAPDDAETPLDTQITESMLAKFEQRYGYKPPLNEQLCDPLLGRIKREIDRKSHTLIPVDRVRTARESARVTRGSSVQLPGDLELKLPGGSVRSNREVKTVFQYLWLLEVLLIAGFVMVGNFVDASSKTLWASLQVARDYLSFVRSKAAPFSGSVAPLDRVRSADEDLRCLWAEHMRRGMTFDQAVTASIPKQEALWLFAHGRDIDEAREVIDASDSRRRTSPPPKKQRTDPPTPTKTSRPVDSTKTGKAICRLWNDGKCSKQCKNGRLHVCNFDKGSGIACGAAHRACEAH